MPLARFGGYDRAAVDDFVRSQVSRVEQARRQARSAQEDCDELRAELARLKEQWAEVENPSYAGLGVRAAELLARAEAQADDILTRANQQADQVLQDAECDAAALRVEAAEEAEAEQAAQSEQIVAERARLLSEAQREQDRAHARAAQILTQARADAEDTRLAAVAETEMVRKEAVRGAEKTQATADREVAEGRRILASEKEVCATQIADAHAAVTDQMTGLLQLSETRIATAQERARVMVNAATRQHDHARAEAERLLAQARRDAEWLVAQAKTCIEQETTHRHVQAERHLVQVRYEAEELRRRRNGIVAQLSPLRELLASSNRSETAEDATSLESVRHRLGRAEHAGAQHERLSERTHNSQHTSEQVTQNDEQSTNAAECTDDRLMTQAEVASVFQVDVETVKRWAADGTIPYVRVHGGHQRFRKSAVQDAVGKRSCS